VVEAYDVRAAAGEQVRSLGATFLEVDLGGIQTEDKGGYAVELSEEALQRGRDLVAEHAKTADVIITTAQVPGRRAPLLMDESAVAGMKRGSVVIDLAGATGGNVRGSQADEIIEKDGVTIMAPTNLPATVPVHASQLYSRNVSAFLNLLIKDGASANEPPSENPSNVVGKCAGGGDGDTRDRAEGRHAPRGRPSPRRAAWLGWRPWAPTNCHATTGSNCKSTAPKNCDCTPWPCLTRSSQMRSRSCAAFRRMALV
jgi:hypothetical protein